MLQKKIQKEADLAKSAHEMFKNSMPPSPEAEERTTNMSKVAEDLKEFIESHIKPVVLPVLKTKKRGLSIRRQRTNIRA